MRPALIAVTVLCGLLAHAAAWAEDHPRIGWTVKLLQWDATGTVIGAVRDFSCAKSGCQQVINLDVSGTPRRFLASISFVARGAYVGLQALDAEVGKVVEFDKGFMGPVFVPIRDGQRALETLRFILTGSATKDAAQDRPTLMENDKSLVFHRKIDPDLTLRVELLAPATS